MKTKKGFFMAMLRATCTGWSLAVGITFGTLTWSSALAQQLIGNSFGAETTRVASLVGYTGKTWTDDYGVLNGNCDVNRLLDKLGKNNVTALAAPVEMNAAFQAIFSGATRKSNLALDSYCFGHTLELVPSGQTVYWRNPSTGTNVYITPGRQTDRCRAFIGILANQARKSRLQGLACSNQPGHWVIENST